MFAFVGKQRSAALMIDQGTQAQLAPKSNHCVCFYIFYHLPSCDPPPKPLPTSSIHFNNVFFRLS